MSLAAEAERITRRGFLQGSVLLVSFAMVPCASGRAAAGGQGAGPPVIAPNLKGSLKSTPWLDSWIRVAADGHITVFTGKVELGQGIRTALLQVAAEELDVRPQAIELITADTFRTPDEGVTAGSHSMQDGGTALQIAAANVRMLLTSAAAAAWHVPRQAVSTSGDGHLLSHDGRSLGYGALAASLALHTRARADVPLRNPAQFRTLGKPLPRIDIPPKLTGGKAYVQDMRLPGMLHARVLRGPGTGTALKLPAVHEMETLPGIAAVVQDGAFTAITGEHEWAVIQAQRRIQQRGFTRNAAALPIGSPAAILKALPSREITVLDTQDRAAPAVLTHQASYSRPWLSHGSIGPSCALAHYQGDLLTIWTHSQAPFDVARVAAALLRLPQNKVRAIHVEGAGCYGHNGADDVAAEAARIAYALPGRPVRLQWMREQEFGWEPLGPGMAADIQASLDAQHRVVAWKYEVWSNSHNSRPVNAGGVLVGSEADPGFPAPQSKPIPMPEGGGDRNANPLYGFGNMQVRYHFIEHRPLRVSALRSLGAHLNVFSIESMLDELAGAAKVDPLTLRLINMQDERARTVMQTAAKRFGWSARPRGIPLQGCGMGFARYKNLGAYCAVMLQIEIARDTGRIRFRRAVAAVDSGQPANPDGIRNQIEGGIIQALSWSAHEEFRFDAQGRSSYDWSTYPIMRFEDIPGSIEVDIVDRPGEPFLGTGECAQGPAAAALANALADAGVRLRDMPLSAERIRAALGVV